MKMSMEKMEAQRRLYPLQSLPQCMHYSKVLIYSAPGSRKATFPQEADMPSL